MKYMQVIFVCSRFDWNHAISISWWSYRESSHGRHLTWFIIIIVVVVIIIIIIITIIIIIIIIIIIVVVLISKLVKISKQIIKY